MADSTDKPKRGSKKPEKGWKIYLVGTDCEYCGVKWEREQWAGLRPSEIPPEGFIFYFDYEHDRGDIDLAPDGDPLILTDGQPLHLDDIRYGLDVFYPDIDTSSRFLVTTTEDIVSDTQERLG